MKEIKGIVLKKQDYKEHDNLITVISNDDVFYTIHARGMNRITSKNASSALPFMESNLLIEDHDFKTILSLRSSTPIYTYKKIREDLDKQSIASCICEYAYLMRNSEVYGLFALIKEALDILEKTNHPYIVYAIFLQKLMKYIGIEPFVDGCVKCCDIRLIRYFSIKHGGFVCENCGSDETIQSKECLHLIRVLMKAEYSHIDKITYELFDLEKVLILMIDFIKIYASLDCKGNQFLLSLLHL